MQNRWTWPDNSYQHLADAEREEEIGGKEKGEVGNATGLVAFRGVVGPHQITHCE